MTSRMLRAPPGSMMVSVKTEKVFPLKASLEEMRLALVLLGLAGFVPAGLMEEAFFLDFKAVVEEAEVVGRGFFIEAAIRLRYHPATSNCIGDTVVGIQRGA